MVRAGSGDSPHLSQLGRRNSRRSLSHQSSSAGGHSSSDNSFGAVRERVQMGIATSQSHTEMLQDLVLSLSSAEGKRDIETEKNVLKDLVKEMVQFRYGSPSPYRCHGCKHWLLCGTIPRLQFIFAHVFYVHMASCTLHFTLAPQVKALTIAVHTNCAT